MSAGAGRRDVRFGVVGLEHLHVFTIVEGLVGAGAHPVAHSMQGALADAYTAWQTTSTARRDDAIIGDDDLDLIVCVGEPASRATTAVAALHAGRHVLCDKPAVTSPAQLESVTAAVTSSGRRWWILFSERFTNRAVDEAVRRAGAGDIGRIVHVAGTGPHTLDAAARPPWFWEPRRSGGILADLATHQIDQFCAAVDPGLSATIEVIDSLVGNVSCPRHPAMQDLGVVTLAGAGAVGHHRVDYLSPAGLGTWGDCRLMIAGTAGTLEVRANVDPAGASGADHLIAVDQEAVRRIDCSTVTLDWADRVVADIVDGTDTFMSTAATARVCRLAVEAQLRARPWPAPTGN